MEELKAVSFFYDIGRSKFAGYSRSNSEYIDNFVKFFSEIEIELLLVTSLELKNEIEDAISKQSKNFKTHLSFLLIDFSEFDHLLSSKEIAGILESPQMAFVRTRSTISANRSSIFKNGFIKAFFRTKSTTIFDLLPIKNFAAPEYAYSEYLKLIWLKPSIVKLAFESKFVQKHEVIAFLDFGIGHGDSNFINRLTQGKISISDPKWDTKKLIIPKRLNGALSPNPWDYANLIDDAFIPTGFFISNYESTKNLSKWWDAKIIALSKELIVVDDQTLMAIYSAEQQNAIQFVETFDDENLYGLERWLPLIKFFVKNEAV